MYAAYAGGMIRAPISLCSVLMILTAACSSTSGRAQTTLPATVVTITPLIAEVGSPELIRVTLPNAQNVTGEWLGQRLSFFEGHNKLTWYALAGIDVATQASSSTLTIDAKLGDTSAHISLPIEIHAAHYRTESISVAPRFVEPNRDDMKLIEADSQLKAKIFAESATAPLWRGNFHVPVDSSATDSFGVRRTYNGKLDSIHKGMDFRAHTGTPVRAGNSGIVVLARRLYFEGNCVVIDHGLGLYEISMHLSRIDVREGEHVVTGQRLGLSGATGRVTGPHLHWAVRWRNAYLDPAKLLKMNLSEAH